MAQVAIYANCRCAQWCTWHCIDHNIYTHTMVGKVWSDVIDIYIYIAQKHAQVALGQGLVCAYREDM